MGKWLGLFEEKEVSLVSVQSVIESVAWNGGWVSGRTSSCTVWEPLQEYGSLYREHWMIIEELMTWHICILKRSLPTVQIGDERWGTGQEWLPGLDLSQLHLLEKEYWTRNRIGGKEGRRETVIDLQTCLNCVPMHNSYRPNTRADFRWHFRFIFHTSVLR